MRSNSALRWLLAVIIIFGLIGRAVTGYQIYTRIAYLGLLIVIGSGVWAIISMRGIRLTRQARIFRASMGGVFEEHYEIKNTTWPACLWVEIVNQSNLPLAGGSRLLTGIGPHQRRFFTSRTLLYRRGAFSLGPTSLVSGDPFGLFSIRKKIPAKDTLVVLPMSVAISNFPPPPGLLPGGKAVRQRSFDVTPHAAGVREYVPGDPMKRIHWPSTAHRGKFMVKEFEQDPQADIWLFLDAQKEVHASLHEETLEIKESSWMLHRPKVALPQDSFEYGISIAASLASYFLLDRRAVGLACSSGISTVVPAERGERQLSKVMETLAFLQPDGRIPLLSLINIRAKLLPIGTGVILITPSTNPELLLAVEDLQRRNLRPVVVIIKIESFGGLSESESIIAELTRFNVPFCSVSFGEDLSVRLALPVVYYQRSYMPHAYFETRV